MLKMFPRTLGTAVLYSTVFSLSARIIVCTGFHRIVTTLLSGISLHPTAQVCLHSALIS